MAFLFKPQITNYVDEAGRHVPKGTAGAKKITTESRKWYAKGAPLPKGKKVPLASDKRAAQQMLAKMEQRIERGETAIGGPEIEAAKKPLLEHLDDYEADLKTSPATARIPPAARLSITNRPVLDVRRLAV
jgi:hypothetical protein